MIYRARGEKYVFITTRDTRRAAVNENADVMERRRGDRGMATGRDEDDRLLTDALTGNFSIYLADGETKDRTSKPFHQTWHWIAHGSPSFGAIIGI